ncbi:DUF3224 domain-containing protein [Chiayiivirga flava]|uniref:DUF3224 domain-containing protein n=1 Tax=Chiayiivirga flava TaxID=659595 RepID=A0A7W8D478_9GAMM|nr:DUF3224 domain-containing protein [Chiayiivirga flava]MBB5207192.1 hypothetical protein [Chiayiivirga flava]
MHLRPISDSTAGIRFAGLVLTLACFAPWSARVQAETPVATPPAASQTESSKETAMTQTIRGEFDVKMLPQPADAALGEAIGRFGLDKRFHGALEATSKGQMLAFRSAVEGSAGYVAMEQVDGALDGRKGTFVLQHSGTMDRGAQHLDLAVVPDSATGELAGLAGRMQIEITGGKHYYVFEYSLPAE